MIKSIKNRGIHFLSKNRYPLILVLLILISLWPLSFFIYVPKWDNINGYLPYRYFISDYLWNGHLPLWNPFQLLGYPGYSDLQSGVWNPIVWIIMLFGKYTVNSLIVELLSCYVFAGLGMYKLSNYLFKCKKTSFILGLSYSLSGFMVGSSQLMVFLIAVTWFPWCIYALLNFFKTYQFKHVILTALFVALIVTGASPAYTIILTYIIVGLFIYQVVKVRKSAFILKKIMLGGGLMLLIIVLLTLPYLISFLEFAPYFNRGEKLEYNAFLLSNPFTPISYISFLLPHSVIAKSDWFNITDLSLRNGYFGIVGLTLMIATFLSKISRFKIILLVCLLISLLLAAGDQTFIFKYLYAFPGFGVFRHPSIFRAFTIFCGLLLAGTELKTIIESGIRKRHKIIGCSLLGLIIIAGIWSISKTTISNVIQLIGDTFNYQEFSESSLSTHLLLNSIVALGLFVLIIILKKRLTLSWFLSITIFVFLDLSIQTQMTAPTTICYNFSNESLSQYFENLPNEINQKDNKVPLEFLDETQGLKKVNGVWQNLSTFNKTLSYVGVNPMRFKSYDEADKNGNLKNEIKHNIIYSEKQQLSLDSIVVGYNKFVVNINNSSLNPDFLILNQNYHNLWKATIDGQDLNVLPHNNLTMKIEIPANRKGKVQFVFDSPTLIYSIVLSLLSYLFLIFILLKSSLKR